MPKEPKEESVEEEAKESPQEEYKEDTAEGDVPIPEEFQRQVKSLIDECDSKECLSFIRDCVYQKEDEMRKAADPKKGSKSIPSSFSTSDMPA